MSDASIQNLLAPHTMRVLLVEDSKLIRDTLISMLSNTQHLMVKALANTKKSAIALLDREQFDMLLVDIELAEGNGFEVIKYVLAKPYAIKPPLIMILTNHAHPQYRKFAKHLGVKYFFDKSLDFNLVIKTIEQEAALFSHQSKNQHLNTAADEATPSLLKRPNTNNKPN